MPTDPAEMAKKARMSAFSLGLEAFADVLEKARTGGYKEFEFAAVAA